jgi:5-methylcytosine-specific restriction endonuclease McrA
MQVDHIWAHSKYGSDKAFNLVATCHQCNRSKSDKMGSYLIRGYGYKIITRVIKWVIILAAVWVAFRVITMLF